LGRVKIESSVTMTSYRPAVRALDFKGDDRRVWGIGGMVTDTE